MMPARTGRDTQQGRARQMCVARPRVRLTRAGPWRMDGRLQRENAAEIEQCRGGSSAGTGRCAVEPTVFINPVNLPEPRNLVLPVFDIVFFLKSWMMRRRTAHVHTVFDPGAEPEQRDPAMLRVQVERWWVPRPPSPTAAPSSSLSILFSISSSIRFSFSFPDRQLARPATRAPNRRPSREFDDCVDAHSGPG